MNDEPMTTVSIRIPVSVMMTIRKMAYELSSKPKEVVTLGWKHMKYTHVTQGDVVELAVAALERELAQTPAAEAKETPADTF